MSATGNEMVKLNQLKMYVKYASDEDVEAYLTPPSSSSENIPVTMLKKNLTRKNVNVTMNSNGLVNISLTLSASSGSVNLYPDDELFSIPSKYAPSAKVTGTLGGVIEISMNTNGVVTHTHTIISTIERYSAWPVKISYEINVESDSNATGNEVVRLSQVKKYLINGGGSGGSGSWKTIWTGAASSDTDVYIRLSPISQNQYTKIAITCQVESYSQGQDSGRYELVIANLPTQPTRFDEDSSFSCAGYGFMVAIAFGTSIESNEALLTISSPSPYDTYMTVTKIEVQ